MRLPVVAKRPNLRRDVNGMQTADDFSAVAHCDEHYDIEAVGTCRDCRRRTCAPCQIEVRRVGTLCKDCAMVRAGVRLCRRVS
jgi:hypothetical protein